MNLISSPTPLRNIPTRLRNIQPTRFHFLSMDRDATLTKVHDPKNLYFLKGKTVGDIF